MAGALAFGQSNPVVDRGHCRRLSGADVARKMKRLHVFFESFMPCAVWSPSRSHTLRQSLVCVQVERAVESEKKMKLLLNVHSNIDKDRRDRVALANSLQKVKDELVALKVRCFPLLTRCRFYKRQSTVQLCKAPLSQLELVCRRPPLATAGC
jgi:hypothetical protein